MQSILLQSSQCEPQRLVVSQTTSNLYAGRYMAVPRLTHRRCFVELTAEAVHQQQVSLKQAAILKTALKVGRLVSFAEMDPIDLVVVGCVAVTRSGGRTGKRAGFADLELAMLRQFG